MSFSSFSNSTNNQDTFHTKHQISASKDHESSDSSQLIIEENENETESGFDVQAFVLPFLVSFLQISPAQDRHFSVSPLSEKLTNPIYLSVCNFRI
ncbi:MAG: hypothetical protein ABIP51_12030 [Bacteroidia bacterium]